MIFQQCETMGSCLLNFLLVKAWRNWPTLFAWHETTTTCSFRHHRFLQTFHVWQAHFARGQANVACSVLACQFRHTELVTGETGKQKWPRSKHWCWAKNADQFRQVFRVKLSVWWDFCHFFYSFTRTTIKIPLKTPYFSIFTTGLEKCLTAICRTT